MKRRNFLGNVALGTGALATGIGQASAATGQIGKNLAKVLLKADVVIVGGGLGGCAAALAALRNDLRVILTEPTDWIGGQVSQQGVPPDEHPWIETHGAPERYRDFRNRIREYYRRNYPLTDLARKQPFLNPGNGSVSRLCHEPRVAVAVLEEMLAPYQSSGQLTILLEYKVREATVNGDRVQSIEVIGPAKDVIHLEAPYFVDATELGDLLPLTGTEYVTGAESKAQTQELHAPEKADPHNNQAFTVCFAVDYRPGENHLIDRPKEYDFWKDFVPKMDTPWSGRLLSLEYSNPKTLQPKRLGFHPEGIATGDLLNLWNYRRIIDKNNFSAGFYPGDITIVNWPQNDYFLGDLVDANEKDFQYHFERGKQLSLSLLYWLQTEAPRPDGGKGWPGLKLRKDVMGTDDGMAKYPYVRESRRIKAIFTVKEEHVGAENRALVTEESSKRAATFYDSVGIGYYHIDLHPSTSGNNYIDFGSLPFQIPLGALLPQRMKNLLPACKNIGTTHITNGCYRLHPVEWSIGEAVGLLLHYALKHGITPHQVRSQKQHLAAFQTFIRSQGVETDWKNE